MSKISVSAVLAFSLFLTSCGEMAKEGPVNSLEAIHYSESDVLSFSSSYGKYLAGSVAQSIFDMQSAAYYYVESSEIDPENFMLAQRTYFYLIAEGRFTEAVAMARKTLELEPTETIAPLVLSIDAAARQSWNEAEQALAPLKPQGLNRFLLPLIQSWILQGQGQTNRAIAALASLESEEDLRQIHDFHAGAILDMADHFAEAQGYYHRLVEEEEFLSLRTVQIIASFLQRHGHPEEAGRLFARYRGDYAGSIMIDVAYDAFQADPDQRVLWDARDGLAEALYGASASFAQAQSFDTALVFARLALLARPDFPYAIMMVGDLLQTMEQWESSASVFSSLGAKTPVFFPSRLKWAESEERLGRLDNAREILHGLAQAYPGVIAPLLQLGDLERRNQNWDAAVWAYRQALGREEAQRGLWAVHYSLGIVLERAKRWPEAEKELLAALDLEPDQPLILNYLGYSWVDQGTNVEKGKELIERAARLRPMDGFIADSLGWAYFRSGDYEQALKELEKAVELEPDDSSINDHLGDVYWEVGRRKEAVFQWNRALSSGPDPDLCVAVTAKLRERSFQTVFACPAE